MSLQTNTNPFVGLRPFESDESLLFFGRQEQTVELLQRLHQHHFVAIIGNSGCGKSSLIRGGLIPRLKAGYLIDGQDRWMITMMKPGQSPIHKLAEAVLTQLQPETNNEAISEFVARINEEGTDALLDVIKPLWEKNNTNFFLLIDQFEELFRFSMNQKDVEKKDEAIDFVNGILSLSRQIDLPVYIVMTMRSDFIGDCAQFYGLPEAMNQSQYLVPRLNRGNLRNVIAGPVKLYGSTIDPALTSKLLNDAVVLKDELPLLQHALMRIWDHKMMVDKKGMLDLNDYESIGGIEKALSVHADEALEGMSENELALTKKIFQSLTVIDENGRKIRRPVLISELEAITGESREKLMPVINRFSEEKRSFLIVCKAGHTDEDMIDISHESLIRQWNTLALWSDEEASSAKIYLHLKESAELYVKKEKDLLEGSEFQIAMQWYKTFNPTAMWARRYNNGFEESIQYLKESAKEQGVSERRKKTVRRNLWILIASLVLLSGVALFFIILKSRAESQKQIAESQQQREETIKNAFRLNSLALDKINDDPTVGLRIAEAGFQSEPDSIIKKTMKKIYADNAFYKIAVNDPDPIYSVAISTDGTKIVTGSENGGVRLWNLDGGMPVEFRGHTAKVRAVAFSPDGTKVLTGSDDTTARLWNIDGSLIRVIKAHKENVYAVAFSHDGTKFLTGSWDHTAILWNTDGRALRVFKRHRDNVNGVAFSPDDTKVLTGSEDSVVRLWNIDGGLLKEFKGDHPRSLLAVAFSPDGNQILTSSLDKTAMLWSLDGKMIQQFRGHSDIIKSIAFSPDGGKIITGSIDGTARLWDLDGKVLKEFKGHTKGVTSVTFTPDQTKVLTASWDKTARLWYMSENLFREFKEQDEINAVAFSPDGSKFITAAGDTIGLWNNDGSQVKKTKTHTGVIKSLTFSPDGTKILSGSADKFANLVDLDLHLIKRFKGHKDVITSGAFSPDGMNVLTGSADKTARLCNLQDSLLMEFKVGGSVIAVAFSAKGDSVLICSEDGIINIGSVNDGKMRKDKLQEEKIRSAAFSSDGNNVLTGSSDGTTRLWNIKGDLLKEFKGHQQAILTVAFSRDGTKILTGSDDKIATLWNRNGSLLTEFKGHEDCVFSVALSPDGTKVLTGSEDRTARLWDIMPVEEFLKSNKIDQLTEQQKKGFGIIK